MPTLTQMFAEIRSRPGVILGRKSVHTLEAFVNGFLYAKQESDGQDDCQFLSGFSDWVRKRYDVQSSQGWAKIIAFFSIDESEELPLFWKLYDEYLEKHHANGRREKRAGRKDRASTVRSREPRRASG